jgi:hypothetical protein
LDLYLSAKNAIIVLLTKRKEVKMTYTIKLETYSGSVKNIPLSTKGQVADFISNYPNALPVGVSVKVSCDMLGISGTLRGKAVL